MDERAEELRLMQRVAEGDPGAFRAIVERHLGPITAYATRLLRSPSEAEEIAQETFLKLWQGAGTWEPRARLSTWLHRIVHNACVDRLRRRREHGDERLSQRPADTARACVVVEERQRAERIQSALGELPVRQRAALSLVHYEGMTNIEAAEVLDVSVDALESLLARGRRTLRERLEGME